jgi:hypothetical protein
MNIFFFLPWCFLHLLRVSSLMNDFSFSQQDLWQTDSSALVIMMYQPAACSLCSYSVLLKLKTWNEAARISVEMVIWLNLLTFTFKMSSFLSVFVFHPEYVLMNLTYVIERSNLICCNTIYNCGNCRWWNCLNPNWFIYLRFCMKVNSNLQIFVIHVNLLLIYFLQMLNKKKKKNNLS